MEKDEAPRSQGPEEMVLALGAINPARDVDLGGAEARLGRGGSRRGSLQKGGLDQAPRERTN